jgi:hypothetical protein
VQRHAGRGALGHLGGLLLVLHHQLAAGGLDHARPVGRGVVAVPPAVGQPLHHLCCGWLLFGGEQGAGRGRRRVGRRGAGGRRDVGVERRCGERCCAAPGVRATSCCAAALRCHCRRRCTEAASPGAPRRACAHGRGRRRRRRRRAPRTAAGGAAAPPPRHRPDPRPRGRPHTAGTAYRAPRGAGRAADRGLRHGAAGLPASPRPPGAPRRRPGAVETSATPAAGLPRPQAACRPAAPRGASSHAPAEPPFPCHRRPAP